MLEQDCLDHTCTGLRLTDGSKKQEYIIHVCIRAHVPATPALLSDLIILGGSFLLIGGKRAPINGSTLGSSTATLAKNSA